MDHGVEINHAIFYSIRALGLTAVVGSGFDPPHPHLTMWRLDLKGLLG